MIVCFVDLSLSRDDKGSGGVNAEEYMCMQSLLCLCIWWLFGQSFIPSAV